MRVGGRLMEEGVQVSVIHIFIMRWCWSRLVDFVKFHKEIKLCTSTGTNFFFPLPFVTP